MKKEPLSLIAIKTLLAVIIFTGVGTIIIGGGWLIGNNYENKTDDKIVKPVDQEMRKCVKEGEKFYLKPGEPQTKECCSNLKTGAFYSIIDDKCIPETVASICIDCPNGICGPGENKCNCPEDCKEEIDTADWKTYRNEEYGFEIILLDSWAGYSILTESWNGITLDNNSAKYEGPKIIIRNPNWSDNEIWQDIPILVFTKYEWQLVEQGNLNISAAPVGPEKLGENEKYIFALPPRWIGFSDALGQNEAREIIKTFKAISFSLNETADWKTYRNEEYGFEVKYPEDWKIITKTVRSTGTEIEFYKNKDTKISIRSGFRYSQNLGRNYSLEEWITESKEAIKKYQLNLKEEEIKIDNVQATKLSYRNTQDLTTYEIYTQKEGLMYEIIVLFNSSNENIYNQTFNQILSTFKFIEK